MVSSTSSIRFTGLATGLDTESIIQELMKVEQIKVDNVYKEKQKLEWKKEIWQEMNQKIYSFYTEELSPMRFTNTYNAKKAVSSNEDVIDINSVGSGVNGSFSLEVSNLATASKLTGSSVDDILEKTVSGEASFTISAEDGKEATITLEDGDNIEVLVSKINNAKDEDGNSLGLSAYYYADDNGKGSIFIFSQTGAGKQIEITSANSSADQFLDDIGLDVNNRIGSEGTNAKFTIDGEEFESESNDITINKVDITLKEIGTTNITVSTDTDAIYDKIKNFINKYNELLVTITEKVDADSAYGYEPLTDEEKAAMTEEEVKLWEDKIKSALLRNDSILESLRTSMRSILTSSIGVDVSELSKGFQYLSDIGIVTGYYTEKGILHIQGDEDDLIYSDEPNKLKEAIEKNPDEVVKLMTTLCQALYDELTEKMKSTELSSAFTLYNDKQIDELIDDYEDEIYELEERMYEKEEYYYQKFAALETAIQQLNSQSAWLYQQLG
ncbi:flagellar filament capping protein FliD [Defluviitalea phaphyphila]|uniref:flagellar filament capping protein FliD n=1 Tax=Defluviitalea phaphyphila TaxID=1473580 RepID=UPI000730600B|nr:flagellar filament capping protein FliD [Defluviitalea phaphyphila]